MGIKAYEQITSHFPSIKTHKVYKYAVQFDEICSFCAMNFQTFVKCTR